MRVLVSVDMEGIAGVVDWDDSTPGAPDYEQARRLMTAEASAAVRGVLAFDGDADVLVADAHGYFRNLLPEALDRRARLLRGRPRADGMLGGLADGVDAVLLIGYHGQAGTERAVLSHTFNGAAILDVRVDGRSLGEIGLNIAYAAAHDAATVLVTGDDLATEEAAAVSPGIHAVEVKRALGGWSASSLHPQVACERIEAAVPAALAAREQISPLHVDGPVVLDVDLIRPVMIEPLMLLPGLERNGGRGLRYRAPDLPAAYRLVELIATVTTDARARL
jgi:D-amino peptidase